MYTQLLFNYSWALQMSALFVANQRVKLSGRYVWIMRFKLGKPVLCLYAFQN